MHIDGSPPDEGTAVQAALANGRVLFRGLELLVAPGALVPRKETELLADTAVSELRRSQTAAPRVIDMCCGAGNLACAVAHAVSDSRVWASDLTVACVELARRNAAHVGVDSRVTVNQGDLFLAFAGAGLEGTIDLVMCNPPYISEKRLTEDRAVLLEHEPQEAFAAGPYGLSIHQRVIRDAPTFLRPGGTLCVEIGQGQRKQVELLFQRARCFEDVRAVSDSTGEARVIAGRYRAPMNS